MEFIIKLSEGERLNNFTLAEAIYHFCSKPVYANELDAMTVANMIREQRWHDASKED